MTLRPLLSLAATLVLSACLGGGGGGDGAGAGDAAASSASVTQSAPGSGGGASTGLTGTGSGGSGVAVSSNALYDRVPIISTCDAGLLKLAEKQAVLAELNAVRALHRLPPVTYDPNADIYVQKSALIGVANRLLTHSPATSLICYSSEGATGSGQSNLFLAGGFTPPSIESIARFLVDDGVSSLGHRRWILHPFLSQTAFGRVDGLPASGGSTQYSAMSLKVIGYPDANLSAVDLTYIAYPEGNYPAKYFKHGWFMSFAVLASKSNNGSNGAAAVNFAAADVQVTGPGGAALTVTEKSANNDFYGLPNHLQWKVAGTQNGVDYIVRVNGVVVGGQTRSYQYTFKVVP